MVLTPFEPALDLAEIFWEWVAGMWSQCHHRLDDVCNVLQHEAGSLLALVFDDNRRRTLAIG
jgi:hypothetical protein